MNTLNHKDEMDGLIQTYKNILILTSKIQQVIDGDKKSEAKNGYFEFAYMASFLPEMISLMHLSIHLIKDKDFSKYVHYPARSMMEITLEMEYIFRLKRNKGDQAVRREFTKNLMSASKSTLSLPGDSGGQRIKNNLDLLDVSSKIMKLDIKASDVSAQSKRNIKDLCNKSSIIVMNSTGSDLHYLYMLLSEPVHANVANVGFKSFEPTNNQCIYDLKIGLELVIRFIELITTNCSYDDIKKDIDKLKDEVGLTT